MIPTFRQHLSVPSSRIKLSCFDTDVSGPIASTESSLSEQLMPRNDPEDGRIHFNRGGILSSAAFVVTVVRSWTLVRLSA